MFLQPLLSGVMMSVPFRNRHSQFQRISWNPRLNQVFISFIEFRLLKIVVPLLKHTTAILPNIFVYFRYSRGVPFSQPHWTQQGFREKHSTKQWDGWFVWLWDPSGYKDPELWTTQCLLFNSYSQVLLLPLRAGFQVGCSTEHCRSFGEGLLKLRDGRKCFVLILLVFLMSPKFTNWILQLTCLCYR